MKRVNPQRSPPLRRVGGGATIGSTYCCAAHCARRFDIRETAHVALWVVLTAAGTAQTTAGAEPEATSEDATTGAGLTADSTSGESPRERLTDLLFSDGIDRIDFRAPTYEQGAGMIDTTVDRILEMGSEVLGDERIAAEKAAEVIVALNASEARGLYATFQKDKQSLVIRDRGGADTLGKVVGTSISIIHRHYGSAEISYREKSANLFRRVRVDTDNTVDLVQEYLETVEFVAELSADERAKYLN